MSCVKSHCQPEIMKQHSKSCFHCNVIIFQLADETKLCDEFDWHILMLWLSKILPSVKFLTNCQCVEIVIVHFHSLLNYNNLNWIENSKWKNLFGNFSSYVPNVHLVCQHKKTHHKNMFSRVVIVHVNCDVNSFLVYLNK